MEKSRNPQNDQNNSQDTSRTGREEQVVNNQEQNRRTNSDMGDSTNKDSAPADQGRSEGRSDQREDQQNRREEGQDQRTKDRDKEKDYKQGFGDNDNRNSDVPDIGREDAERTERETPKM